AGTRPRSAPAGPAGHWAAGAGSGGCRHRCRPGPRPGTRPPPRPRTSASGGSASRGVPMAARDEVLARIRSALGRSPAAGGAPAGDRVPRGYRSGTGLDTAALISLLTERLREYGSVVRRCPPDGVLAAVGEALADRGAHRIVVPPGLDLPGLDPASPGGDPVVPGLAGVTLLAGDGLSPGALDAADGVITAAALAIAETGRSSWTAGPARGAGRCAWARTTACASCTPGRSSGSSRRPWAGWPRGARAPGSAAPPPPVTSNWTGSRACTARARWRSS